MYETDKEEGRQGGGIKVGKGGKRKGIKILAAAAPSCAVLILNHCSTQRDCLAFHLENRDLSPRRGLLLVVLVCVF